MRTWYIVSSIVTLAASLVFTGCSSFGQKDDRVELRKSGGRLQDWKSLSDAALDHWPFVRAAVAAYQDADDPGRQNVKPPPDCLGEDPHNFLKGQGWELWDTLPLLKLHDTELARYRTLGQAMRDAHLRVKVWSNSQRKQIFVAFGGTVGLNFRDWKSNLQWLLGPLGGKDEYDAVTEYLYPIFKDEYER